VTAIVTDGDDTGSNATPDDVRSIVEDMIKAETNIILGIGVSDNATNFNNVFQSCGIPPEWILSVDNSPSEWRKAFGVISKSSQVMSKSGMNSTSFNSASSSGISSVGGFEWDDEADDPTP
jgi:hypothetical protein